MAINYDDYKKKYKDQIEANRKKWREQNQVKVSNTNKNTTTTKEEKRTWFNSGAFSDGYDFGDITKTILGTSKDMKQDFAKGVLRIGEGAVDTGAYLVGGISKILGNNDFADKTKKFISRDLIDEYNLDKLTVGNIGTKLGTTIGESVGRAISNKDKDELSFKNMSETFKDKLIDKSYEDQSLLGDKSDSLVQSAGQLGGTFALSAVGVPWWATTGVTSFGGETQQAFNKDATYGEAGFSGLVSAGAEILTEKISGGISFGGKTLDAGLKETLTKKISNKALQNLTKIGIDVTGEGLEEIASEFFSTLGQQLSYEKEETWNELLNNEKAMDNYINQVANSLFGEQARENYAEAFIGGAILGGASSVIETKRSNSNTSKDAQKGEIIAQNDGIGAVQEDTQQEEQEEIGPVQEGTTTEDTTTNTVIPPTAQQELTNITNQIDELETMLDTSMGATQQQEVLSAIKELEQRYNELLQQNQTQDETVFKTANTQENVQAEELGPVQAVATEQISQPTTQEVESNSLVEAESNTPNVVKNANTEQNTTNEEVAPIKERKTANTEVAENLQDKSTQVMTEEEYLASKGYVAMGYSEPGLHKSSARVSQKVRDKQASQVQDRAVEYDKVREELRKEYQSKVDSGEIRKPTKEESLLRTAQGNEDNESVQSARRLLKKRGIDWKTGEKIDKTDSKTKETETKRKTPTQEELDNLEDIRKNKSGSEYASAYYDLEKKYKSGLYKGLNEYKSTGKALVEEIAPVKETVEDLTKTIKDTTKEMKALAKEIKAIKSSVSEVQEEFKALTEEDLPMLEQQWSEDFKNIDESNMPDVIEDTTPDIEDTITETDSLFDIRDYTKVGDRKINAYQYDNPEVKPFFQYAARGMYQDLEMSTKGERYIIGDISQMGNGDYEYTGTKRHTTDDIAELLDGVDGKYKLTYKDIKKGLDAIIKDEGAENNVASKRIEFFLDKRLRDGYTTIDGYEIPPNQEYLNTLQSIGFDNFYRSLSIEDIAPSETITEEEITQKNKRLQETFNNEIANENHPPLSDEFIEELNKQSIEWARRSGKLNETQDIAPVQSLSIEQAPDNYDNGGPMIRVSPELQKRTLNKNFDNKEIDWDSLEDTSQGQQQALIKNKLGSTLTDTSIRREQRIADEQAEKFGMEAEEQNNAETITQILTEKPQRVKGKWENINRLKKLGTIKLVQKDYYLNKLARESKNQSLSEDSNNLRHAHRISSQIAFDGIVEWKIDRSKSRRKGRFTSTQKAQGIEQIYESIENKGLTHEFDDYAYNLHNIDRMSIESKARDKMTELKDTTLKGYSINQIESMAKGIEPNEQQLVLELNFDEQQTQKVITAAKEYVKLSKEHNKTVFGDQITADVSKENIKKYEENKESFEKASQEITKLNDALLDFDVESGRLTAEDKAFIKERYPNYVPVYYAIDETIKSGKKFKTKDVKVREALDVAEGGSSEIIPLKDAMEIKIRQKVAQNLMNKLGLNIMHTFDKQGKLNVLSSENVDAMERYAQSNEQLLSEMQDGGYALTVYENGNKIMFEIPLEVYEALKPSDIPVVDTLNTLVDIKRSLLTEYNLYFATRNIIRDMPTAFLQSQNSLKWFKNVPEAVRQVATKGQYYQLAQTLGAGNNDYANMNQRNFADIGPTSTKEIQKQMDYQGNKFKTGWEAFKNWKGVKWIADVNAFMEQVPRMAEFITSVDTSVQDNINPLTGGKYTYAQDEVTVNFGKGGDWTKTADRNVTNFMNASLQGTMKLVDIFRDAYAYKGAKGLANTIIKYGLAGASMLALMNWAWDDDEDYEELSDYVKNNYYILGKYGDGQFIKIPKGRTNAVIESIMNNGMMIMSGERGVKEAVEDTISVIENNITPTTFSEANLFSTLTQIYTNTSWYGEDLVPSRLQDLPAEEQYDETTDSFSIWLGQQLGLSPYKINYFLNQSSGFVGDMVLPLLTDQAETPIDNDLAELLLGQFYKDYTADSTMKNQSVTDFYDLVDELNVASRGKDATEEDNLKYKYISTIQSQMNELYAEKREIQANKDLTDSEKIDALREAQRKIDDLAQEGLEQYDKGTYKENYASIGGVQYQRKENEDGELYWSKVYDDEAEDINSLGFTDNQLNEYFSLRAEFNNLNDSYYEEKEYLEKTYGKNSDEYDAAVDELYMKKKNTIIDTIMNSDFSSEQKAYLYDKYYSSEALDTVTLTGINIDYFLDYQKNDFKADYNSKGKAIPNSRKNKVIKYINEYDLSIAEKAILIKSTNTFKFNDYNNEIVDYVSKLDISDEDKVYIIQELDMTIDENGYVHWK